MSIAIAIAVPDGIALAADTQTTWNRTITAAKQKGTGEEFELAEPIVVPVGWSRMARKLFPLEFGGSEFAVCTAGASQLNSKTMYAIFKSLERSYQGTADCNEVVRYLVGGVQDELKTHFEVDDLSRAETSVARFIVAGHEDKDVSKPFVESHIVFSGEITTGDGKDSSGHVRDWTNTKGNNRYGGCWIGRGEFISHVVLHSNKNLPPISGQYQGMTLADAVDYTKFLVEFTCDFQRFAIMVPDCGRPIISATLTPGEYQQETV